MKEDYASHRSVRRSQLLSWGLTAAILLGVVWAMSAKIQRVVEARNISATRESLEAGLTALQAEQVAHGRSLESGWSRRNPFVLLRWQSEDYCGELSAAQDLQGGCWYYWPVRGWVVHRSRFTDELQGLAAELRAFQLSEVSSTGNGGSQLNKGERSLQLIEVPAAELKILADAYQ